MQPQVTTVERRPLRVDIIDGGQHTTRARILRVAVPPVKATPQVASELQVLDVRERPARGDGRCYGGVLMRDARIRRLTALAGCLTETSAPTYYLVR